MRHLLKRSVAHGHLQIAGLYQRHATEFLLYIRRHVPSQEDAEDILLEVFIAALENPRFGEISEQEQLAWLQRVARNKCIDFYRRSARRSSIPLEDVQHELYEKDDHAPDLVALNHEEHALLHTHLASLPEIQQQVIHLRFAEDLRSSEIARQLDKSDGAIRTMLSRILNLLRNIYANSEEEISHE